MIQLIQDLSLPGLRMQSLGFLSTGAYGKLQFPALETPVSSV